MFYLGRKYLVRFDPQLTVTGQALPASSQKYRKNVPIQLSNVRK